MTDSSIDFLSFFCYLFLAWAGQTTALFARTGRKVRAPNPAQVGGKRKRLTAAGIYRIGRKEHVSFRLSRNPGKVPQRLYYPPKAFGIQAGKREKYG